MILETKLIAVAVIAGTAGWLMQATAIQGSGTTAWDVIREAVVMIGGLLTPLVVVLAAKWSAKTSKETTQAQTVALKQDNAQTAAVLKEETLAIAAQVAEKVVDTANDLTQKVELGNALTLEVKKETAEVRHEVNSRTDKMLARIESLEKQLRSQGTEPTIEPGGPSPPVDKTNE